MLLTLVDPHRGFEKAYNRWYERDHFYAGCMIGPWLFAGSRWVATRELKDLRWPQDDETVAEPDRRRLVRRDLLGRGRATTRTTSTTGPARRSNALYADGRGFPERRHIHTVLFDHLGAAYRDADPVPVELALDHGYDGIVAASGSTASTAIAPPTARRARRRAAARAARAARPSRSPRSWTPSAGENEPRNVPMDLGSRPADPSGSCRCSS